VSSTPEDAGQKPKLIIDEDWKSQVQAEKEALEREKRGSATGATAQPADAGEAPTARSRGPLPPATLAVLCTTLATQALAALGQLAEPGAEKIEVSLEEAQHFIDTLEMLETKTAGNRSPEESHLLDNLLHELRLAFVDVRSQVVSAGRT
jgi:uncharacterized protein DUF1844